MFVLSMKTTRLHLAAVIAGCGILIAVLVGARGMSSAVPAGVGQAADPVAYVQSFGYAVLENHMETCVAEAVREGRTEVLEEAVELVKKLK